MSEFKQGDRVQFKGDDVVFRVSNVNDGYRAEGTYDLVAEELPFKEPPLPMNYIPGWLLEKPLTRVKQGQVWLRNDDKTRAMVTTVRDDGNWGVAREGFDTILHLSPEYIRDNYELGHDVEP